MVGKYGCWPNIYIIQNSAINVYPGHATVTLIENFCVFLFNYPNFIIALFGIQEYEKAADYLPYLKKVEY